MGTYADVWDTLPSQPKLAPLATRNALEQPCTVAGLKTRPHGSVRNQHSHTILPTNSGHASSWSARGARNSGMQEHHHGSTVRAPRVTALLDLLVLGTRVTGFMP